MNERSLLNIIRYSPMVVLPFIIILIFFMQILNYNQSLSDNYKSTTDFIIQSEKNNLVRNANLALEIIEYQQKLHNDNYLELFKNINKKTDDYYFIFDKSGRVIIHTALEGLEGSNIFSDDNHYFKDAAKIILDEAKESSFIKYIWQNPKTKKFEDKISYIVNIPNTNLVIGSGFYPSSIEQSAKEQKQILENQYQKRLSSAILIAGLLIVLSIFIAKYIANRLLTAFEKRNSSLKKKSNQLKEFNKNLNKKVENRTKELENEFNKMQNLAFIDDLTKIYNRYAFFKKAEKQKNRKFSLIMFDLDHFKKINDTYGHIIGDFVLFEVCRVIEKRLRDYDVFARIGGEEFIILLPNTTLEFATVIANRIKIDIEKHDFKEVPRVTISLGVVESNSESTLDDLLQNVDKALYKAKDNGRNQVVVYNNIENMS